MVETDSSARTIPEYERMSTETVGLQGRLLLADPRFFDPQEHCTAEQIDAIASFEQRAYQPYERTAQADRARYWQGQPEQNFSAQHTQWTATITERVNHQDNQRLRTTLMPLFRHIGISPTDSDGPFTQDTAVQLYQRYFSRENAEHGVKQFVSDVLSTYQLGDNLDRPRLLSQLSEIKWLATIFGEQSSEMITQLILAETQLKTNSGFRDALRQTQGDAGQPTQMRINALRPTETTVLRLVHDANPQPRPTQPDVRPAQPPAQQPPPGEDDDEEEAPPQPPAPSRPTPEPPPATEQTPKPSKKDFPIMKHWQEIKEKVQRQENTLIIGKTGSGKTIKGIQIIRDSMDLAKGDKLVVTQPRQVNTSQLSGRVAKEMGLTLGEEIGYQHGDDRLFDQNDKKTDTLLTTEGTLLRKLLNDPLLEEYSHVMIDEVHVRSTDTEELLFYLKQAQRLRREQGKPPLKLIAASATVDKDLMEDYFDTTAIEIEGETYPVEEHFSPIPIPTEKMPEAARDYVKRIVDTPNSNGDIIIFVAGVADIDNIAELITPSRFYKTRVIKLHANSPPEVKVEVEKEAQPGERRIIIATNVAETGITIPGLKYVINTGEEYEETVDIISGLKYLQKIPQSRAGATQRAGRAGRLGPGVCYHLFDKDSYWNKRPAYPVPEIQRSDLAGLLLRMKKRGYDINDFDVLSAPLNPERVAAAQEALELLGAIDKEGKLTKDVGEEMLKLPVDYHFARMIVEAKRKQRGGEDIAAIAAIGESRNFFSNDVNKKKTTLDTYKNTHSDFLTYLAIWKEYVASGKNSQWAEEHGLNTSSLQKIDKQIKKIIKNAEFTHQDPATPEELEQYIVAGFADRQLEYNNVTQAYQLVRNPNDILDIKINRDSALAQSSTPPLKMVGMGSGNIDREKKINKKTGRLYVFLNMCQNADLPVAA